MKHDLHPLQLRRAEKIAAAFLFAVIHIPSGAANPANAAPVQVPGPGSLSAGVPCKARSEAVIANDGDVYAFRHSLVDSFQSDLGAYGHHNESDFGGVQASGSIVRDGGVILGTTTDHSPSGLAVVPVPSNAIALPLGSASPGRLRIHRESDSISLRPGNYVVQDLDVRSPGAIKVPFSGVVSIFVTGRLRLDGRENVQGHSANLQIVVTSAERVELGRHADTEDGDVERKHGGDQNDRPDRGDGADGGIGPRDRDGSETHGRNEGRWDDDDVALVGLLYAPLAQVDVHTRVFGSVVGATVRLDPHSAVHRDLSAQCPAAPPPTPATAPASLPAPPPPVVGCYVYTRNGWQSTPCATEAFIEAHYPHPDVQLTMTSTASPPLVFGQVQVTVPEVQAESDVFNPSVPLNICPSSITTTANKWSVQNNTNLWSVASGASKGDTAGTQFVVQTDGSTNGVCVWNVDVTSQDYSHRSCVTPTPSARAGNIQPFDSGNIAGYINGNGTMTMVASLTWVPSGQPNVYSVVAPDTYGLAGGWSQVSGGILGMGNCSQAQFASAEAVTQVVASTCSGDTQQSSPVCTPPNFQPNASVTIGSIGTVETNNLTVVGTPSLSFLNTDLAVSNATGTTSGLCLGPNQAYVKDSPEDFGAVPSTIGNQAWWESPDIFLVPHGTPVDLNSVSTESILTPGGSFDIWVRLHNDLGCADVTGAKTRVYLADPSALSVEWAPITGASYVGNNSSATGVTVPAGGQALIGPLQFTAPTSGLGDGHKCILAAIEADGEPAPANSTDAPDSNQVAQRNVQFVGPCEFPLTNGTSSDGNVQLTLSVAPITATAPSLTALPDVEVAFDDADSSWFNAWNVQSGNGSTFSVTHNGATNTTTVRLGAFSINLAQVPLAASQTRNATATISPQAGTLTLQIAAKLFDGSGNLLVTNGGSCTATVPVIQ